VAKTLFEAIGSRLGQKAAQAKNVLDLLGGTEEDSLRAEIHLGHDLTAATRGLAAALTAHGAPERRFEADTVVIGGTALDLVP